MSQPSNSSFPLTLAQDGERVKLINVHGKLREKLASMSLGMGDVVEIVSNHGHGPILIMKQENRYILGGGMAHKIEVVISQS
ncbi:MAG: ferrous iron transport protein [Desulfobulbaceae bacterium]|jgi:Fe2+ transport system protein FeoA|nr:MAG: ferrous iron transport protein [Desulfobulbaceae bacterium]